MAKCLYRILINNKLSKNVKTKEYTFSSIGFRIGVGENRAYIEYSLNERKNEISFAVNYIKDAFRRIMLLHLLQYGKSLNVKSILVIIGDKSVLLTDEELPTISSVVSSTIELNEKWKDSKFQDIVLRRKKSEALNDQRISALSNFLASTNKKYEPDKLLNLWTAMNACYSYVYSGEDMREFRKIQEFLAVLGCRVNIEHIREEERIRLILKLSKILSTHKYGKTVIYWDGELKILNNDLSTELEVASQQMGLDTFGLLMICVPYYHRCKYSHGQKPQVLFSICNDSEINMLQVINGCLWDFLKDFIPGLFNVDLLTEERFAGIKNVITVANERTEEKIRAQQDMKKMQKQKQVATTKSKIQGKTED